MYFIRETPWYIFYPLVVATLCCIFIFYRFIRDLPPSNQDVYNEGRMIARRLAQGRFYLKMKKLDLLGITLELETADLDRKKEMITFQARHPDFELLKSLSILEIIRFEYSLAAVPRVGKAEVCAYLRLKAD